MTQEQVLALFVTLVSMAGGVLAVWWRIENRIKAAEIAATIKAEAALAAGQLVASALAEHKLHVAEDYVTKSGLRETTEQIMTAIGDLKQALQGLNTRMDQFLLTGAPKRSSRSAD